jgi:hypothetical protein
MQSAGTSVIQSKVGGKDQSTVYAAADLYISDFGPIDIVPNRQFARYGAGVARNALLIDPTKVAVGILDDVQERTAAETRDGVAKVLIVEYALIMKTQAAQGVVADLFGLTAST